MPTVGLVLPTSSYRGPDFIAAADDLGVELVIVSDASLGLSSGRIVAAVVADCADPAVAARVLVEAAADHPLDAVVGVDDAGVMTAAIAAAELGLPHNQPEAVAATRDKSLMRELLSVAGAPQPRFRPITAGTSARDAARELGYPLVLKPVSLSGSRGVMRVDDDEQLDRALQVVGGIQADAGIAGETLLLEEFIAGPEIAIEGLLSSDGLEVLAVFDKPDPLDGPYFEETLYVTPSRHAPQQLERAIETVAVATAALGLAFGPIHAEVRLGADGPRVIEVAARSIGGLCGRSLRFGMLTQSLEVLLLRAALGLNRRGMSPAGEASGAMMIPIQAAGILRSVRGREAIAEIPGIEEVTITIPIGRPVRSLPEGDRYLGFIIARGDGAGFVEGALREAHGLLDIRIEST
jgi:biotin carboxylase